MGPAGCQKEGLKDLMSRQRNLDGLNLGDGNSGLCVPRDIQSSERSPESAGPISFQAGI